VERWKAWKHIGRQCLGQALYTLPVPVPSIVAHTIKPSTRVYKRPAHAWNQRSFSRLVST
jgi:hypothetical protein